MLAASCHCGAVRVEVDRRPRQLTDCNCSICRRYAARWAYYRRGSVRVECAPRALKVYTWGRKAIAFHHCRTCGCVVFHQRTKDEGDATRMGINTRLMPPDDVAGLRARLLDGASTWKYLD